MVITESNIKEQKIIYAARKVFYEKGFKKATTRLIAENADVNHAMIHYYFRDKKKLAVGVLDDFYKKMNFLVIPHFSKTTDPMLFEAVMLRVIYFHILNDSGFLRFYCEIVNTEIVEDFFMDYGIKLFLKAGLYHNKNQDEKSARLNQWVITSFEQKIFNRIAKKELTYTYEELIDFLVSIPLKLMNFKQTNIKKILKESQEIFDKIEPLTTPIINHFEEPILSNII